MGPTRMSPPKTRTEAPAATADELRRELEARTILIQDIRRDLIQTQITVLELNDSIMLKETEKSDAVSLLAELELALEARITFIVQLDRELNRQLAELRRQLADETSEKQARDVIIQDFVQKLDTANREIGATHQLAGNFARDLARANDRLTQVSGELAGVQSTLAATQGELSAVTAVRVALDQKVRAMEATLSWRLTKPFRALRRMFS